MLKSILAASDLSARSIPAVLRAVRLAEAAGARLCIVHVVEDDLLLYGLRAKTHAAEDYLTAQVAEFGTPEGCEVAVVSGHAFQVLVEEALAREADLIVVGAHRRQTLRDAFVGTTSERVTRTSGRPVLVANSETCQPWRKVFIATDLSETSAYAACRAHALGLLDGAEVTFVHAHEPSGGRDDEETGQDPNPTHHEVMRFIQELGLESVRCSVRLVAGPPAQAIAGAVEDAKPDLLVLGTRGLSRVKRLFLGSVAQELMGGLEIDVLAVPPETSPLDW